MTGFLSALAKVLLVGMVSVAAAGSIYLIAQRDSSSDGNVVAPGPTLDHTTAPISTGTPNAQERPSSASVVDFLSNSATTPSDWLTYVDDFYKFRMRYPSAWQVTYGETAAEPHGILLEHLRKAPESLPSDAANTPATRDSSAFISISPFIDEPPSDAKCRDPREGRLAGNPIKVCTYSQDDTYPNIQLMPDEWSVISVTLLLDQGPVYISIDLLAPVLDSGIDSTSRQLGLDKGDVLLILKSLELS